MSTQKNGFRDADVDQTPSAGRRPPAKAATAWQHQQTGNDPLEDVFLKPMEKPWRSPPTNGGPPSSASAPLPMQMTSSTPLHFNPGITVSPAAMSAATTRMSLDLFHKNAFKYNMEQPSRPSLTTDFALSALKNSFSMSSLSQTNQPGGPGSPADTPPSAAQQTPDVTARLKWERPFNSLTRLKERGVGRVQWRRSFGASPLTVKEDAVALNGSGSTGQNGANTDWLGNADYTFLMSCDLIESCRSLNGEMSWDNRDLEHFRMAEMSARSGCSNRTRNESVAVGCQTDAEIIPDLQLQLQLLREWLNRMETKVPKLVLRPKWTRETLDRRIVEYKRLKREIDAHSAEFGAACLRCASWNPRVGRLLENRYHRLLLRILEWTYHLEALAKKPPEFWSGRRAAISSPESEVGLPSKLPRLDDFSPPSINHATGQVVSEKGGKMRQSNAEGGLSPPLPVAVPVSRTNMGVYEFKHPDTDTENTRAQEPSSEEDVKGSARKRSNLSDGLLVRSNDSSENEWIYSPNTSGRMADEFDGHDVSVRKKLSFESEEDNASSSKSWYQYSSSESDWLQSGGIELDEASEPEDSFLPPLSSAADLPEESAHKDAARVYDKEKVHKLVTEAEQMVSMSGDACRSKNRKPEARYSNPELAHNSECDASSELTSEGESDGEVEVHETPGSNGRRSATLNRTFVLPEGTDVAEVSPVVMRTRHRIKPQRPLSFSGLSGTLATLSNSAEGASARWAASETALNHMSSPTLSPCLAGSRPLMCHASTQKDRLSPSTEGLGSSLAGLSSSGSASAGGVRQRRRRHSARLRNMKSISRRGEHEAQIVPGTNESNNITLQARLSVSAASASSSGEGSSAGAGSQRSRRIVKSSTLTRIVDATAPLPIIAGPVTNAQSTPLKPMPPSTNSSPRSAPSDGELGLAHVDETSNFSEQAWDNYVDRYASEAYSEDPPDAESARRLLEFGEDYRNDLDSLSDCPSSLSADLRGFRAHHLPKRSPPKRPKGFGMADRSALAELRLLDSDSDVDDLVHIVETSASQYTIALNTFHKVLNCSRLEPSQYAELLATCRTNIQCLQTILSHLKMSESTIDNRASSLNELKPVQDLIEKWSQLDVQVSPLHQEGLQQRQLQQQVQSVRGKLIELETLVLATGVDGDFQLNLNKIHQIKAQVEAEKESLLQVNVDVHSCMAQQPTAAVGINLKDDVSGLYQMWERLVVKVLEKEVLLEDAEKTWKEFQEQLLNLKAEIAADQKIVKSFIDLQNGDSSPSSTPDAKLEPCQNSNWMENWSSIQLSIQCDSGISSGSDGEFISLGEREKRLHTLRQLARKLENALAPGNAALTRINRTLDQTQQDLILLHNQLSQLPPIPVKALSTNTLIPAPPVKEISVQTDPLLVLKKKQRRTTGAVAGVSSTALVYRSAAPYWWRIFKAALPFHLALVVLLLAACVMEPSCCNYLNTFGSSLVPKLSYLGGPPPI